MCLSESILIPQFLMRLGIVKDSGGREFPSGIVIVKLNVKSLRFVNLPDRIEFGVQRFCLRVFTDFMGNAVMNAAIMERVWVVSLGAHGICREIPEEQAVVAFFGSDFMGDTGLKGIEAIHPYGAAHPKAERFFWNYVYCVDFQEATVGEQSCGNEDFVIQPDDEGDGGDVLEGEFSKVDLSGLAVGEGDVVVGHAGMLGTEAANGNGLHAAGAAIVTHHHT